MFTVHMCSRSLHFNLFLFLLYLVIETQLVPNDNSMTDQIVFPNETMAEKFGGVQIIIPSSALKQAEGVDYCSVFRSYY